MVALINIEHGIPHLYMAGNPDFDAAVSRMDGNSYELYGEVSPIDVFLTIIEEWWNEDVAKQLVVGIKVRIKKEDWFDKNKPRKEGSGGWRCLDDCLFVDSMIKYCGKEATISRIFREDKPIKRYILDFGNGEVNWSFTYDMFDVIKED